LSNLEDNQKNKKGVNILEGGRTNAYLFAIFELLYPELLLVESILDKSKRIQKIIRINILRENLGRGRGRGREYLLLSLISTN